MRILILAAMVLMTAQAPAQQAQVPSSPAPTLTNEQRLSLENGRLKLMLLQMQADQVQRDLADQVRVIESAHPGWILDPATLAFRAKVPAKRP